MEIIAVKVFQLKQLNNSRSYGFGRNDFKTATNG